MANGYQLKKELLKMAPVLALKGIIQFVNALHVHVRNRAQKVGGMNVTQNLRELVSNLLCKHSVLVGEFLVFPLLNKLENGQKRLIQWTRNGLSQESIRAEILASLRICLKLAGEVLRRHVDLRVEKKSEVTAHVLLGVALGILVRYRLVEDRLAPSPSGHQS